MAKSSGASIPISSALALAAVLGPFTFASAQDSSELHPDGGFTIESDALIENCSDCHALSDDGRMSRISYLRKTPEGWQASVRRMASLHDVPLHPAAARDIVRYLSNRQGIAPEELRPGLFEVERRMVEHTYEADRDVENTCIQCHSFGRVMTQRRTKDEWALLLGTHRGLYPLVDFQAFRRPGPAEPGEDARHPMDRAIDHLGEAFPLETPEWSAWSATMRSPRLEGTWTLSGHQAGKGPVYGTVRVSVDPDDPDAFTTQAEMVYARSGQRMERSGRGLVYTGYQWRGRNTGSDEDLREVMFVERDWQTMFGRWYRGAYDEIGLDVELRRADGPVVLGVHPKAVQRGQGRQMVTVYGANLPPDLDASALDFGPGVRVASVERARADAAEVWLEIDADAAVGHRDLFVETVHRPEALVVYDEVSRIEVTPEAGMARIGGANFPKQYQQFEAHAFHDGPDGEAGTDDDLALGEVDVTWSVEEYAATFDDQDVAFVGELDQDGLFTPNIDGPNPERPGSRNNIGDVWVVATYAHGPARRPLRARSHLLVTVPLYMIFDPMRSTP